MVSNNKSKFEHLNNEIKLPTLVSRLLSNRDITNKEDALMFLHGTLKDLHDGMPYFQFSKCTRILYL